MAPRLPLLAVSGALVLLALASRASGQMCSDVPTEQYEDKSGKYAIKYDVVQGWYKNR